jgi:hypothetical protein
MDTPTEILHTILLGIVKYFWGQTVWLLDKSHLMSTFQARLTSIEPNGLNAPNLNADYICRYKGSLIGKHMKSLAQIMPFLIFDLVPQTVLHGWIAIGKLTVLLWHTEITNTEEYLGCSHLISGNLMADISISRRTCHASLKIFSTSPPNVPRVS